MSCFIIIASGAGIVDMKLCTINASLEYRANTCLILLDMKHGMGKGLKMVMIVMKTRAFGMLSRLNIIDD